MSATPTDWGTKDGYIPKTEIKEHKIVPAPFIAKGDVAFKGKTEITLATVEKDADIYYSLGSDFIKYSAPFEISEKLTLKVYAEKDAIKSATITTDFFKIDPNLKIELKTKYANQYNGGGENALIDGIVGADDFRTGTWQGYSDEDVIAIVDLGSEKQINEIEVNFLKDHRSLIFLPTEVEYLISSDGKKFQSISKKKMGKVVETENVEIKKVHATFKGKKARYIKVIAKKLGILPKWHLGYKHDGRSWIFVDEIQIR
jgi:hypothetical protein